MKIWEDFWWKSFFLLLPAIICLFVLFAPLEWKRECFFARIARCIAWVSLGRGMRANFFMILWFLCYICCAFYAFYDNQFPITIFGWQIISNHHKHVIYWRLLLTGCACWCAGGYRRMENYSHYYYYKETILILYNVCTLHKTA